MSLHGLHDLKHMVPADILASMQRTRRRMVYERLIFFVAVGLLVGSLI